jgi:hypothetical protein
LSVTTTARPAAAQSVGVGLAELGAPAAHCLVGDDDAWLEQQHSTSRKLSGDRKYSHTQGETTSTGYRCPLYDGDALPTHNPLHHDQPEDHPTRSANVTVPSVVFSTFC